MGYGAGISGEGSGPGFRSRIQLFHKYIDLFSMLYDVFSVRTAVEHIYYCGST